MIYEVSAYIYGKKIGDILLKDGVVYFEYDVDFKDASWEISPLKLPLSLDGVYTNTEDRYFEGLAGVFHDTLPDKFGTKVIERFYESKGVSVRALNVIQKLMFVGDKSIGAIRYKPTTHTMDDRDLNALIDLKNFYENAKKIINGDAIEVVDEMLNFMDSAASAGGARAKAVIGYNPDTKEMISGVKESIKDGFEHYLIKFDIQKNDGSSSDFTKLEYIYMRMAKEVGIDIPEVELLHHHNLSHYLIKRFDRVGDKSIHLHSVAGLTHTNFNLPLHYSYDELFRLTRYMTKSQDSVEELYRRMVFNIIGRNQDDHAKNFAFMMDERGMWSQTPAYDITYANGSGYTKNHQLSLRGKVREFTREDLLSIAKLHAISESSATDIIDNTKEIFSTFTKRARDVEIERSFIKEIDKDLRLQL